DRADAAPALAKRWLALVRRDLGLPADVAGPPASCERFDSLTRWVQPESVEGVTPSTSRAGDPGSEPEGVSRTAAPSFRYSVSVEQDLPRRRRPSSVVGGAALVIVSAVLVAGGAFGLGFSALAVGGALLLRPPRARGRRRSGLVRGAARGLI